MPLPGPGPETPSAGVRKDSTELEDQDGSAVGFSAVSRAPSGRVTSIPKPTRQEITVRRFLVVLALVAGSVVMLGGSASASECAYMGPDLSRYGIYQVQYCGPKPF